jgi:hypothetical protein
MVEYPCTRAWTGWPGVALHVVESAALSLAGLVLLLVTATALAVTGDLTQPAPPAGCVSETGAGPCADGHGLLPSPSSVALASDGKSVYVASGLAVARFNRAP